MAKQLSLLDEPAVAHADDDGATFTATEQIRRRNAIDAYDRDILRRTYNARREAILASGDVYRIANLNRHDVAERKRK